MSLHCKWMCLLYSSCILSLAVFIGWDMDRDMSGIPEVNIDSGEIRNTESIILISTCVLSYIIIIFNRSYLCLPHSTAVHCFGVVNSIGMRYGHVYEGDTGC